MEPLKNKKRELLAEEVIEMALRRVEAEKLVVASSFSLEAVVVIHMFASRKAPVRYLTLDTGRLPEETYQVMESIRAKYGIKIELFSPDRQKIENLVKKKGFFSFRDSVEERKECCLIRKVEPLNRALAEADGWVCGLRREQTTNRKTIEKIERDERHRGIWKFNPLADWTFRDVKTFVRENSIPYNRLYDKGYKSIGCGPCTRAVQKGEGERSGRWWWENGANKECGIHFLPTLEVKK